MSINSKQSVKLEKGMTKFENYFKQMRVPFKIYANFECNLRGAECCEGSYTKKHQDHIPCSFLWNCLCQSLFIEVKMQLMNLLKQFLKEYKYCKKVMNKHFNKNLIMSEEEGYLFQ